MKTMKRIVRNVLIIENENENECTSWRDWSYIFTGDFVEKYKDVRAILVKSGVLNVNGAARLPVPVFMTGGKLILDSDANVVASGGTVSVRENRGKTTIKLSGDAAVLANADCTVFATDDARVWSRSQSEKTLIDACGAAHVNVCSWSTPHVNLRDTAVACVQTIPFHSQNQGQYGYFQVSKNAELRWLDGPYSTTQPEILSGWVKEERQ